MDIFKELPPQKRSYMEFLFRNCTEEVKYYMTLIDIEADRTFIKAGTDCTHIFVILSGKVTGVEWPMHERPYSFKDFGPGDFFGEIECFAGLPQYRISIVASTKCRVLSIPADAYMDWMRMDVDALFLRTQENMRRLITQTAEARIRIQFGDHFIDCPYPCFRFFLLRPSDAGLFRIAAVCAGLFHQVLHLLFCKG